jgi:hypothetical protein
MATGSAWWQENADRLMKAVERQGGYVPALNASAAAHNTVFGRAPDRLQITRVVVTPDAAYTYGGVYLVNRGTAGTANTGTLASKTASAGTLSAGTPYTLTLGATVTMAKNEYWAFSRATANGTTALQGFGFEIEYELLDALKPS